MADDEHLAYGDYHGPSEGEGDERGFVGNTFQKIKKNEGFSSFFNKVHGTIHGLGTELGGRVSGQQRPSSSHSQGHFAASENTSQHRFGSFADRRDGNDVKWYVDGASYMWAVSVAIERARDSIWILDWWLSPELYLRRPPSRHEQYRIDRMLLRAAQRGVRINIIVYKEVTQALTRKYLSPTLPNYLHSLLPRGTDPATSLLSKLGLAATFIALEHMEAENPLMTPPISVSSAHTKHTLEGLHQNICVFRHPDHLPDAQNLQASFLSSLQNLSLTAATASKLPGDTLKAMYGMNEDVILYWAHHEKLCLIDGSVAFMGGLDLCYGRWDTNQHAIADAHPDNLENIIFPGQSFVTHASRNSWLLAESMLYRLYVDSDQHCMLIENVEDFNNARIMDFQDVPRWENNKLDRTESSRMGWSDISISLHGPVVQDLRSHFVDRWNFIYNEKYDVRRDVRYSRLSLDMQRSQQPQKAQQEHQSGYQPYQPPGSIQQYSQDTPGSRYSEQYSGESAGQYDKAQFAPQPISNRGPDSGGDESERGLGESGHHHFQRWEEEGEEIKDRLEQRIHGVADELQRQDHSRPSFSPPVGPMTCQIVRSAAKWSNGNTKTEHSIADAYCEIIQRSEHFVYIENQFFITATGDQQKPVKNKIGAAMVERIIRAARAGEKYKMIIMVPAVPAFAGDLKDDAALGTRAIMEFQYNSINRGGHSILEEIANAGFNPLDYIRFYNLRNYDRINAGASMQRAEAESGVDYETARRQHDAMMDPTGTRAQEGGDYRYDRTHQGEYQRYQQSTSGKGRWDSVSECYMLGGRDIREVPWEEGNVPEIEAFVSEELYIHSKVLIADDRTVICGSANLNDRSQLGYHDSEIAIIVEDPETVDSYMDGRPWRAARFAATLRRQLFRKHLGLLRPQDLERPDQNFEPIGVPNLYDFNSAEDRMVMDPLSEQFHDFWNSRARQNTDAFGRIFHPVPHDDVRTWKDYDDFYEQYFKEAEEEAEGKKVKKPAKYKWGHVVASNFSPGQKGVDEVKDILSTIKGTLVEMPLLFLIDEDIAKEGFSLNAFTEEVYT